MIATIIACVLGAAAIWWFFSHRQHGHEKQHRIADNFTTIAALKAACRSNGMESCNLIVAVDFTKSNEWTGARSYGGRSLHTPSLAGGPRNHYEQALGLCAALSDMDEDGLIPCYGFGDATTRASGVFSFLPDDAPCVGLEGVLARYRELAPAVTLSGGTSFAPAIRKACALISAGAPPTYHILLLICDGQVSSECQQETVAAIVEASAYPLSIVCVGVGDGPWEAMETFDDDVPARKWDNFQFVPLVKTLERARRTGVSENEAFALAALMEVPEGFAAIKALGLLGGRARGAPTRVRTLEPPALPGAPAAAAAAAPRAPPPPPPPRAATPPAVGECACCLDRPVDRAFPCGHAICGPCEGALARPRACHVCRAAAPRSTPLFL